MAMFCLGQKRLNTWFPLTSLLSIGSVGEQSFLKYFHFSLESSFNIKMKRSPRNKMTVNNEETLRLAVQKQYGYLGQRKPETFLCLRHVQNSHISFQKKNICQKITIADFKLHSQPPVINKIDIIMLIVNLISLFMFAFCNKIMANIPRLDHFHAKSPISCA